MSSDDFIKIRFTRLLMVTRLLIDLADLSADTHKNVALQCQNNRQKYERQGLENAFNLIPNAINLFRRVAVDRLEWKMGVDRVIPTRASGCSLVMSYHAYENIPNLKDLYYIV